MTIAPAFSDLYNLAIIGAVLLFAYFAAYLLSRRWPPAVAGEGQRGRLGCIDGLRGYLALLVFVHHLDFTYRWRRTGLWVDSTIPYFKNAGQVGVALFFLITAVLFTHRLLTARGPIDWRRLYISRVLRIYPLYLFAVVIVIAGALLLTGPHLHVSAGRAGVELARWLLFVGGSVNGVEEARLAIAGADWSLKYEWLFYLSLPLVSAVFLRSRLAVVLVLAIGIAGSVLPLKHGPFSSCFLILFVYGGLIAKAKAAAWIPPRLVQHPLTSVVCVAGGLASLLMFPSSYGFVQMTLLAIVFIPIALGNSIFGLLETRASIYLGEISYSIYLIHGVVLYVGFNLLMPGFAQGHSFEQYLLLMPALAVVIVGCASISYALVESPCIALGKKLQRRVVAASAIAPSATSPAAGAPV